MEVELGLKITHTRDDLTSITDLRITKDPSGPVFLSRETDTKFILFVHLKGYRKENIDIKINGGGNQIAINGKKPVQEMVLLGWIMRRKDVELRAFKKVFRIPDGVVLDRIKANFKEEESTLTIIMPKSMKGVSGVGIEEVEEETIQEKITEAEIKKMEETDQIAEKNVDTREPKMTQAGADLERRVPEKGIDREAPEEKTVAPHIESIEENNSVVEQVAKEFPEREGSREMVKEKSEEPKIEKKEEVDQVGEDKVEKEESKAMENAAEEVKANSEEPKIEKKEEIDQVGEEKVEKGESKAMKNAAEEVKENSDEPKIEKKEVDQVGEEKVEKEESKAMENAAEEVPERIGETLEKESKEPEIEKVEATDQVTEKSQETLEPELPKELIFGSEEHIQVPESIESTKTAEGQQSESPNPPSTKVEEEHTKDENHKVEAEMPEGLKKQEPSKDVQESTKPEPDQKPEQAETLNPSHPDQDQPKKNEVEGQKETHETGNEIKEEARDEVKAVPEKQKSESAEVEKEKNVKEGENERKQPIQKRSKLCTPLVVAGSAFLVSIIVLVMHFIRAKKR